MLTRYHYFVISILISTQEKNPLKPMVFRLCFGTYIWKIIKKLSTLISKWSFDFKIWFSFQNVTSIPKWIFSFKLFKIVLWFRNGALISKWSINFKMELRFQNRALLSKLSFNFKSMKISVDFEPCIYSKFGPRTYTKIGIFFCCHVERYGKPLSELYAWFLCQNP